jgi:hypothetical protein
MQILLTQLDLKSRRRTDPQQAEGVLLQRVGRALCSRLSSSLELQKKAWLKMVGHQAVCLSRRASALQTFAIGDSIAINDSILRRNSTCDERSKL